MSALPLRLDYPSSLNASEFWHVQPILHSNMQKLVGNRLMDIPILEFQDIFTRSYWGYKFPKKINGPIVIVVDDFTKIKEIVILYRIKVVLQPKCCCFSVLRKREVMSLTFSKDQYPGLFSRDWMSSAIKRDQQLQEAQLLFRDGFYYVKPSCFTVYKLAKVRLD